MNSSLLNKEFIVEFLTSADPYCDGHGSQEKSDDLAAGILYYGLAYAFQFKTCVCLGSGGGFVPRLMRQAQRDLGLESSRTILVDGAEYVGTERREIWGTPAWRAEGSKFRQEYPEVEIVISLTETAYHDYFVPNRIEIDYLHIDADHHYDGVKKDWDLYHRLVADQGIITIHDTVNYREPCGVPQLIEELRESGGFELLNLPIAYGTAILRKQGDDLARRIRKRSRRGRVAETAPENALAGKP